MSYNIVKTMVDSETGKKSCILMLDGLSSILEIKSVDMEGADGSTDHVNIPKLIGRPVRRDLT